MNIPLIFSRLGKVLILAVSVNLSLISCGGGGGGGGISGAAFVSIQAQPQSIDTGDRVTVEIEVEDIHENGIALKVKFPSEISFVESSAEIQSNEDEFGIVPDVLSSNDSESFIVFYIDGDDFGEEQRGKVKFELQGKEAVDDAAIEVDPDVDDPLIDNTIEFNVEEPQFEAEDSTTIDVKG